jgi:hypothetical protein
MKVYKLELVLTNTKKVDAEFLWRIMSHLLDSIGLDHTGAVTEIEVCDDEVVEDQSKQIALPW